MTTALQAAKAYNRAHPPRVTLDQINKPHCPHHAICEECGEEAGEHIHNWGKYRCPTPEEMRRERDRIDQQPDND